MIEGRSPAALALTSGRQNAIGALRLALATMVVYSHAHLLGGFDSEWLFSWSHQTTIAGTIGVQCFFALSGWLVTTSWRRHPSLVRYSWHRLLRLVPAFWTCLAITAFVLTPVLWWTTSGHSQGFFSLDPSPVGYVWRNLLLPRSQIAIGPFPDGVPWAGDWNGSLWTLTYEGACYLAVAVLGLAGLLGRWRGVGTVLIGGLLLLHIAWAEVHPDWLPRIVGRLYDTPGKLISLHFFAGAMFASWPELTMALLRRWWFLLPILGALFICWRGVFHPWLSPLVLPPAVLWFAYRVPLKDIEERIGGDYSYGVYVYGYPMLQILAHFRVQQLGFVPFLVSGLLATLVLAVASWHFIERPALSLRSIRRARVALVHPLS